MCLVLPGDAAGSRKSKPAAAPEGKALVIVYRRGSTVRKIMFPSVFVNDYFLGDLYNSEYVSLAVQEGTVVVTSTVLLGGHVKIPSPTGYWASLPGCAGLDWGRLAFAPLADLELCDSNLTALYEECGTTGTIVGSPRFGGIIMTHVPACNHRLDGADGARNLLFLASEAHRIKIEVEAGKTYYVEWSISLKVKTGNQLQLVDAAIGAKDIRKLKPAKELRKLKSAKER